MVIKSVINGKIINRDGSTIKEVIGMWNKTLE